jgi:aerobic carbon-monoxide dehydrogenase large subunit
MAACAASTRDIPGVRAIITAAEIGTVPTIPLRLLPLPGTERFLQPVIAAERVRYVGEPIAVVLADSAALAEDGVGAIALDIEELTPVADFGATRGSAVRGERYQSRDDLHRRDRRRRGGISRCSLRPA